MIWTACTYVQSQALAVAHILQPDQTTSALQYPQANTSPKFLFAAASCGRSSALTVLAFAGSVQDIKWESVQVGQVLQVNDDELFPADLLCLYTALPDKASLLVHNELRPYSS